MIPLERLHPLLVHFPIALILSAAAAELLALVTKRPSFRQAGAYCLVLAVLGTIPTYVTGQFLSDHAPKDAAALIATHERFATATLVLAVLALGGRVLVWRKAWNSTKRGLYLGPLFVAAVTVGVTGHYGGMMVFGEDYFSPSRSSHEGHDHGNEDGHAAERSSGASISLGASRNTMCPVLPDEEADPEIYVTVHGRPVQVCCPKCRRKVEADPERYFRIAYPASELIHETDHAHDVPAAGRSAP